MADFIYDSKGIVARIQDGKVYRDSDNKLIALCRGRELFSLDAPHGEPIGHLRSASGSLLVDGNDLPGSFAKLLTQP